MSIVSASINLIPGVGRGRKVLLTDIEAAKKNEWDRRRKLRIQQVRQQANEIANNLRAKNQSRVNKEKNNAAKEKDEYLKLWECKKVNDLQTRYQECLKNVGQAHTQAAAQPDIDTFLTLRRQIDDACANIRGRHASDVLRNELQRGNEQQETGIRNKKIAREKEDLRANLVASLPRPQSTVPVKKSFSSNSCHNRPHAFTKRMSPNKKPRLVVNKDRQKLRILQEIPTNLPSSRSVDDFVNNSEDCSYKARYLTKDVNGCGVLEECNNGFSCTKRGYSCNEDTIADSLETACVADTNKYSEESKPNCLTNVTKKDIDNPSSRINARLTVKTISSKNTGSSSTNYKHCSASNAQIENNRTTTNRSDCINTGRNESVVRRRRYSDSMDIYSDDGFDSDVTWPPSSLPRQRTNATLKSSSPPTSRTTEYYDHNNRFQSVRTRSKPDVSVKRVNHLPNNGQSIEEERKIIEEKVSKTQLLGDRQAKRSIKAIKKQQVIKDFQNLINDLKTLDRKERQLRCSAMRPEKHDDLIGETMRLEKLKSDQKKMEMIIQKAGGGLKSSTGEPNLVPDTGCDDHSIIDTICDSEQMETPKLNVAEFRPYIRGANLVSKGKEHSTNSTGFINPNSNRLTLQNLMKRINEQRESLFSELKKDSCDKDIMNSLIAEDKIEDEESHNEPSKNSSIPAWAQDVPVYCPSNKEVSPRIDENDSLLEDIRDALLRQNLKISDHPNSPEGNHYIAVNEDEFDHKNPCDSNVNENRQRKQKINEIAGVDRLPQDHSAHVHTKNVCVYSKIECDDRHGSKDIVQNDLGPDRPTKEELCCDRSKNTESQGVRSSLNQHKQISECSEDNKNKSPQRKGKKNQKEEQGEIKCLNNQQIVPASQMSNKDKRSQSPNKLSVDKVDQKYDHISSNFNENSLNLNRSTDHAYNHVIRQSAEGVISTNGKNGDSSESGTTLYSLDMALSQLSVDSFSDTPNSSFKGVKIVVKVSGQSNKNRCKKNKRRKGECIKKSCQRQKTKEELEVEAEEEEEKELATVDEKIVPRKSNGSTSTSYLSPPDHLTPRQITMLNDLLKDLENKNDRGIPLLKYYIQKLLSMTRESVERLGVSSSDVSIHSSLFEDNNCDESMRRPCHTQTSHCESPIRDDISDEVLIRENLEILRRQINEKNDMKQLDTNDIIDKYTELAKRYADRISSLAELIGDTGVKEIIKKRGSHDYGSVDDETTYLSLPPQTNVKVPVGNVGPNEYLSQTFDEDSSKIRHSSWHNKLSAKCDNSFFDQLPNYELPNECSAFVGISPHISPSPPRHSSQKQHHSCKTSVPSTSTGTKPPPTLLNGKTRICTPHELSTIQEVDTPSTSCRNLPCRRRSPRKPNAPSGRQDEFDGLRIPLDEQQIEDVNLTFLTINSHLDDSLSGGCDDISNAPLSAESCPDIMNELIRRGILTSPFDWAKEMNDGCNPSETGNKNIGTHNSQNKEEYCTRAWVKERLCSFLEDPSSSQMADEEVRDILKESSPEDIEAAFDSMGLGWASTTLRKTRRASEFNDNSSSNGEYPNMCTRSRLGRGTSTPDGTKFNRTSERSARLIPRSESDLSTVKQHSNSDMGFRLTPPNVSLQPGESIRFTTLSDESLGSFS